MRISIMQPYIFPYLGYFHLIEASDRFIFYDDVNFIRKGWINKNKILLNGNDFTFTVPLSKASQNKLINQIKPVIDSRWKKTFFNNIKHGYNKSPYYEEVLPLLEKTFDKNYMDVADLCINSIRLVYEYLGISFNYSKSSIISPETKGNDRTDRLITITKKYNAKEYINTIGGTKLYKKKDFEQHGITLHFIKSKLPKYKQINSNFVPNLSILDILMFNQKETVVGYFNDYELL